MPADTGAVQDVLGFGADVCSLKEPADNFGLTQTEYCLQGWKIGLKAHWERMRRSLSSLPMQYPKGGKSHGCRCETPDILDAGCRRP
jgi:hypothetical protein